jgi:hypothetical protein
MDTKQVIALSAVIFKGKAYPARKIWTVGEDITDDEAKMLLGIGNEVAELTEELKKKLAEVPETIPTSAQFKAAQARIANLEQQLAQRPTLDEMAETKKFIETIEQALEAAQARTVELQAALDLAQRTDPTLAAITDAELAGILKARKVKVSQEADRNALIALFAGAAVSPQKEGELGDAN